MNTKNNPYQYTRGLRFRAEPERQAELFKEKSSLHDDPVDLSELAKQLLDFPLGLKQLLFDTTDKPNFTAKANTDSKPNFQSKSKNSFKFQTGLFIKNSWLKTWHKDEFYLHIKKFNNEKSKNKQGKYDLNSLVKLNTDSKNKQSSNKLVGWDLKNWINNWEEKGQILKSFSERSKEAKVRNSDIAETIRFFLNRNQWNYIYTFLEELNAKETFQDQLIEDLKHKLGKIRENLNLAEQKYSSFQSSGIEIAKASFNYYTLNKKPKEYYDNKIANIKNQLYGSDWNFSGRCHSHESGNPDKLQDFSNKTKIYDSFSRIKKQNEYYKWTKNEKKHRKNGEKDIFYFKSEQEKLWLERYLTKELSKLHFNSDSQNSKLEADKSIVLPLSKPSIALESQKATCTQEEIKNTLKTKGFSFSLDQTYAMMKAFKAEQKSIFYELITHISSNQNKSYEVKNNNHILKGYSLSYDKMNVKEINKIFSLFQFKEKNKINKKFQIDKILISYKTKGVKNNTYDKKDRINKVTAEECYQAFINLNKQIQDLAKTNNPTTQRPNRHPKHVFLEKRKNKHSSRNKPFLNYNKADGQKLKKDRGAFGKYGYFKEYGNFCEIYKHIAQQRGLLIAQIKGLEREKQESQQTDFWSLIYCKGDIKQLWLVPKEKRQQAWRFIYDFETDKDKNQNKQLGKNNQYILCFESLTMRAFHKLCFAEQSSFILEMQQDKPEEKLLLELQKDAKQLKTNGDKDKLEEKKQKQLIFLKAVLKSDYAKQRLKLDNFNLQNIDNFDRKLMPDLQKDKVSINEAKNLEEFEKCLEKACYYTKKITLTEEEKQGFLEKNDVTVLNIKSYDLEGRNKNTHQSPSSPDRLHTDWWKSFWKTVSQNFITPDSLNFVEAIKKSGESEIEQRNGLALSGQPSHKPLVHNMVKGFILGEIRLNPEVKIRYRKKDPDLQKYFKQKAFPEKFKHRNLQDQWTVNFTLALNAGKRYEELGFTKPEDILNKIQDFNQKLNKQMDFKTTWKYGIDRGQKELATLCLTQFDPTDTYQANGQTIVKPKFPNGDQDIKCWTLKGYNYTEDYKTNKGEIKKRYAVKNLSFFVENKYLNDTKLFKKENVTCLDLTTAKVIKGKIITNGDILTYLKLKKTVAKRQLYELYNKGQITTETKLEWSEWEDGQTGNNEKNRSEGVLNIKNSEGEKTIYYYIEQYKDIPLIIDNQGNTQTGYNKDSIKNSLNSYLNQLRQKNSDHTPSLLQVNHLRDAITANMVGVICHLQKTYPGFVILEDLKKGTIDRHFFKSNENIARRLENALYNKFQTLGLVPPHVKDIIRLREGKGFLQPNKNLKAKNQKNREENTSPNNLTQIGAMVFVPEKNTSQTCLYCEKLKNAKSRNQNNEFKKRANDEKFRQHRFLCSEPSCGFDTYFFKEEKERAKNYIPQVDETKRKQEFELFKDINDNDKVAAYNIAKKAGNLTR